jgi:hypothetical protein
MGSSKLSLQCFHLALKGIDALLKFGTSSSATVLERKFPRDSCALFSGLARHSRERVGGRMPILKIRLG